MDPIFFELYRGLDRAGPGTREDTLRALALTGLGGPLRILDLGAGPGAASLALLAALPEARATALDLHEPFLRHAETRARAAGLAARLGTVAADMARPPFEPDSFDLLWSEGAAYIPGVEAALAAWRPLVAAGGRIAFSEAVWLTDEPHPETRAFWTEYPAMTDIDGTRRRIARAGWRPLGDFVLGEAAWTNYYEPLAARAALLAAEHGADHPVLAEMAQEIAIRRDHAAEYGYAFFVAEPA
jgi:SAM-dependent methyltransferase